VSGQFGRLFAMSVSTIQFQFSNFSGRSRSPRALLSAFRLPLTASWAGFFVFAV